MRQHISQPLSLAALGVGVAGAIALAAFVAAPLCNWASAGGGCRGNCEQAYAACYASSGANRQKCDSQLKRCLERCLRAKSIN